MVKPCYKEIVKRIGVQGKRDDMTVKEQHEFLMILAGEAKIDGRELRCQSLLDCAATMNELWMDMKQQFQDEYIHDRTETIRSTKIKGDYISLNDSVREI